MKKLKLSLKDIKIESFEITSDKFENKGTVRGFITDKLTFENDQRCFSIPAEACIFTNHPEGCYTDGYSCYCEIPPNTFEDHATCERL